MSKSDQKTLNGLLQLYLEKITEPNKHYELEVKFGTRNIKKIDNLDFIRVLKKIKSLGFTSDNEEGNYLLRIQQEEKSRLSKIRTEVTGIDNIKTYCQEDSIENIDDQFITYERKKSCQNNAGEVILPVNKDEFNLRVSLSNETILKKDNVDVLELEKTAQTSKKLFRFIHRTTFTKDDLPYKIDMSVVKTNKLSFKKIPILTTKFIDANIFNNIEKYEIEIEFDQTKINKKIDLVNLSKHLNKSIIVILGGLQNTNYPIPYTKQEDVLNKYKGLFSKKPGEITNRDFLGPSSLTLQMENLVKENPFNILENYSVTDKADGDRKLLFIDDECKIYLIDTNMNVEFTGCKLNNANKEAYKNTIIDGEHILHNKHKKYINLYAAFDIYYLNGKLLMNNHFIDDKDDNRLTLLKQTIANISFDSITNKSLVFKIECKKFYTDDSHNTIFDACKVLFDKTNKGNFIYNTDGLIFTPTLLGVGCSFDKDKSVQRKVTWDRSFKWKPASHNTIDFLVKTVKTDNKKDFIGNKLNARNKTVMINSIEQFKKINLYVGFNQGKHGFMDPVTAMFENHITRREDMRYKAALFYPSNPYDDKAHICHQLLKTDQFGENQMMTAENEVFTDDMIVEFSYKDSENVYERWRPLRVRYDKTMEYKRKKNNFGNAFHVANTNWKSIHYPITEEILSSNDEKQLSDIDDIYYNKERNKKSLTINLRKFHNTTIKKQLISLVSKKSDTLIDYAVGKGGDLQKWILSKLSFVLGIDVSVDNIENKHDGACARYLNLLKEKREVPRCIFVVGNTELNIKTTEGIVKEKNKEVIKLLFGKINKVKLLPNNTLALKNKVSNGFNVSSCQFALHYFFKNKKTLEGFLRNVTECTKLGGYFIGTCFNGKKIFDMLKEVKKDDSVKIFKHKKKIFEIIKKYDESYFENDISSLGYEIEIFQETINKYFNEYLVNYEFLERVMNLYGFIGIEENEFKDKKFKKYGSFEDLYDNKANLSKEEKKISFLNNYFVFKKIKLVDLDMCKDAMFKDDIELKLKSADKDEIGYKVNKKLDYKLKII
jgi:hypothetical protein